MHETLYALAVISSRSRLRINVYEDARTTLQSAGPKESERENTWIQSGLIHDWKKTKNETNA